MLTFFRRIQKSLIDLVSVRKYLLYAVGEIALVVIGILIALQINNWNEDYRLEKEIQNSLLKLRADLKNDLIIFGRDQKALFNMIQSAEDIRKILHKNNDLSDVLTLSDYSLSPRNLDYFLSSYEAMINTGIFYKIADDNLSRQITEYYRVLEDMREILARHNNENSRFKTQDEMNPFNYLIVSDTIIIANNVHALKWMNDPTSSTYTAVQVYLADYINKYTYTRIRVEGFKALNQALTDSIDLYLK